MVALAFVALAAIAAAAGGPGPAHGAWKRDFTGSIGGSLEVKVTLEAKGAPSEELSGSYIYAKNENKKGKTLRLAGKLALDDTFSLDEQDESSKDTGHWEGRVVEDGGMYGIWAAPRDDSRSLPFELHPVTPPAAPPLEPGQARVRHQHALLTRTQEHRKSCSNCQVWVFYPEVEGLDARVAAKVQRAIGPKRGFRRSLDELRKEFNAEQGVWEQLDFSVKFNRGDLLSLEFEESYIEAYPTSSTTPVTVDLRTGEPLKISDVLTPDGTKWALERLNRGLKNSVKESIRDMQKADKEEGNESDTGLFLQMRAARFSKADLQRSLSLTETGLSFSHPIDVPHVIQNLAPTTSFTIPWKDLAGNLAAPFAERVR